MRYRNIFLCVCFGCALIIGQTPLLSDMPRFVSAKSGLTLRSEPSRKGQPLLVIPYGARLTFEKSHHPSEVIEGIEGLWQKTQYGGKTGWVFSGFTSTIDHSLRLKSDRGESCSVSDALIALPDGNAMNITGFRSKSGTNIPCVISILEKEKLPCCVRDVRISETGRYLVVTVYTDTTGVLTIYDLRDSQKIFDAGYASGATDFFEGEAFYFWQPGDCGKGMRKLLFRKGNISEIMKQDPERITGCHAM